MNSLIKHTGCFLKVSALLMILLNSAFVHAAEDLSTKLLDQWIETTEKFKDVEAVSNAFDNNTQFANQYSEPSFKALSFKEQDNIVDTMLNSEGVYDDAYAVINQHDWNSAGDYLRASERIGKAIGAYFSELMLANVPEEQRQMIKSAGGSQMNIESTPEDLAFIGQNWDKVSKLMGSAFDQK